MKKKFDGVNDKKLYRIFLIENISELKKNPWIKPANIISILALTLSIILGTLNLKLHKQNEEASQKNEKLTNEKQAIVANNVKLKAEINKFKNKSGFNDKPIFNFKKSIIFNYNESYNSYFSKPLKLLVPDTPSFLFFLNPSSL